MGEIPTAEEVLDSIQLEDGAMFSSYISPHGNIAKMVNLAMVEFAKLHVKAALKEALDSIPCLGSSSDIATYEEVEEAVLNSYPLENIK